MTPEETGARIAACFVQHPQPCVCYLETLKEYVKQKLDEAIITIQK
jgi:hypothetical protein